MWKQRHSQLGVDCPTTFCCLGNLDSKKEHKFFFVRSLPAKAGGSQYELIAIVTDVDQNVNEGNDGIEHMYNNWMTNIWSWSSCRMCGHKDPYIPLDPKPFGFPFDRKIDFDIHEKNTLGLALLLYGIESFPPFSSVSSSLVQIIFLAGIMPDEMIGSGIFLRPTTSTMRSTTTTERTSNGVCKTRVMFSQVRHKKSGNLYKVWWCRIANGRMKILKYRKIVTR